MVVAESPLQNLWPLVLYFGAAIILISAIIGVSYFLGQRHMDHATGEPYESGIVSYGSARLHLSAKFYLVALFFVIFDIEAVFVFAWAVSLKVTGWPGYFEMLFFIGVLVASLIYLWRIGALDWASSKSRRKVTHAR